MKKTGTLFSVFMAVLSIGNIAIAQSDSVVVKKIADEVLMHSPAYENLRVLTKNIGHRLSGSVQNEKAVQWGKQMLKEAGADSVWLQPVWVPKWVRGEESLHIKRGQQSLAIPMLSLGNSDGTQGKALTAPIVCFETLEALKAAPEKDIKGKIVFFNYKFRADIINAFEGYGDMVKYRYITVNEASKKGAVGYIMRSVSTGPDDAAHTGSTHYEEDIQHIPAITIGNSSADLLAQWCATEKTPIVAVLQSECGMKDSVLSYNVIGEIKGKDRKIITVGGHLDSWDVGEGAQDDGAGCVQSIEVLRVFKALGLQPKHTIRAVLFANEENGGKGGDAYADSAIALQEQHLFAIESDEGGYTPRGFSLEMDNDKKEIIYGFRKLLEPFGIFELEHEGSGVDVHPLRKVGASLAGLEPDSQRYFNMHHSNNDVFEDVNKRELLLGAAAMGALIYLVDQHWR